MSIQKDYLERAIERLVQALAALLKLGRAGKPEEALERLQQTGGELLGMDYGVLRRMDPESVARMLEPPEKVLLLARLVAAEAEVHALAGAPALAARLLTDALLLLDAAQARRSLPLEGAQALREEWTARRAALA